MLFGGCAEVLFAGTDDVLREDLSALVRVGTLLARRAGNHLVNVEVKMELGCGHYYGLYVCGDSAVERLLTTSAAWCFVGGGVLAFLGRRSSGFVLVVFLDSHG